VIVEVSRRGVLIAKDVTTRICSAHPKACICRQPILLEVKVVLDQKRSPERVISDTIAAHPWIAERQRQEKNQQQNFFVRTEPAH
jgi:hypothetical protein